MNKCVQDLPEELVKGSLSLVVPLRSCCNVAIVQEKKKNNSTRCVRKWLRRMHLKKKKENAIHVGNSLC